MILMLREKESGIIIIAAFGKRLDTVFHLRHTMSISLLPGIQNREEIRLLRRALDQEVEFTN